MAIKPLNHNVLNIDVVKIPKFEEKQLQFLSIRLDKDYPVKMNTLRDRVQNFQDYASELNANIKSNNNISLIRLIGTVILVAGGSLGLIYGSLPVGIGLLAASFLLMSIGTLYLHYADAKLSRTLTEAREEGNKLDQDLDEASTFWSKQFLSKVQSVMGTEDGSEQQLIQEIQKGIEFGRSSRDEDESR